MEKSESIKELATALCNFQGAVEKIKKGSENPFFHSKYADLSSILDGIRKPLFENGLSFVQFPIGQNGLETMLMHTSGEWMSASYEMKPTKADPQSMGSVITYQKRYALGAILGLSTEIDDDGNKASEPVKETKAMKATEPQRPMDTVFKQLDETKTVEDVKAIWDKYDNFWKVPEFVKKVTARKEFLTIA